MNFSVYNTESLNNFPDSGIYSTYFSHLDGVSFANTAPFSIAVDDEYIYYPSLQHSYISKNIQTIAVLNTNGDIISQVKPILPTDAYILYIDDNYVYFSSFGMNTKKNSNKLSRNINRFNKNTCKIDPNFCLGGWNSYVPYWMNYYNNKYYIFSLSNFFLGENQIYPNLNDKSDAGIFIIKNDNNISNLGIVNGTFSKIKIKNEYAYICGNTAFSKNSTYFSKIFRIKNNNEVDKNFYPYIERINSTSALAAGGAQSQVVDFDFDNEGIYIGGNFLTVNGDVRTGLAKIDYSGNTISGFNPVLGPANLTSFVQAVVTSGSGVFIGGAMNYSGDTTKSRLLKLNNDGTLNTQFTGYQAISSNIVSSMLLSGNSLYAAGNNILSPGGVYGQGVFKFDANNGSIDPNFNIADAVTINDMKISGNNLYVAINSADIWTNNNSPGGAVTRTGVIKVNASNGEPDANFQINFNTSAGSLYNVTNMLIKGNELHIVGNFTGINNYRLNGYAVVDTTNGTLLNTVNNFSYQLASTNVIQRAINYNSNNDTIIIAGNNLFPYSTGYNNNYDSRINVFDNDFNILTGIQFRSDLSKTAIGANLSSINYTPILFNNNTGYIPVNEGLNRRVDMYNIEDGSVVNNRNTFYLSGNGIFTSAVKHNNNLYFGGNFDVVNSLGFTGSIPGLVKTNLNGVIDSSFNLNLTGASPAAGLIQHLKIIDNNLYIIGSTSLTGISGVRINNFAKYDILKNSIDTGFNNFLKDQAFVRNIHNDNQNNLYFVFSPSNYLGEYTGLNRINNSGNLFKFNSGSYTPDLNFSNKYFWLMDDISIDNNKIYAPLRNTQKISGSNIYKINKKTREILPHKVFVGGNVIYDMYSTDNSLYVCGNFTGINHIPQTGICKLNKSDLSIDSNFSLNTSGLTNTITKILEKDNDLYLVGSFSGMLQSGIATQVSGICKISKTDGALDTSFKINHSGSSFASSIDSAINGNYIYIANTVTPFLKIIDINAKQFSFTGVGGGGLPSTTIFSITSTPNNLFACSSTSTPRTDSRLVGGRGRSIFMIGLNSGELMPPYSFWSNQNIANFTSVDYISSNNSVCASVGTLGYIVNSTNPSVASQWFLDADKMYVKNKRNLTYAVSTPSTSISRSYSVNKNETYILYNNYLLSNPEDNVFNLTNNAYARGIIKYDAIKERYDIII